jgi:hypothetical protein
MKPEVGSAFTSQAAHSLAEGRAGIPQAAQPVLPIDRLKLKPPLAPPRHWLQRVEDWLQAVRS